MEYPGYPMAFLRGGPVWGCMWLFHKDYCLYVHLGMWHLSCVSLENKKKTEILMHTISTDVSFLFNSVSTRDQKAESANSVDHDEVAHNEPPHLDLHCLLSSLWILNMIWFGLNILWKFTDENFDLCFLVVKELSVYSQATCIKDISQQDLLLDRTAHLNYIRKFFM